MVRTARSPRRSASGAASSYVIEASAAADPRIFENNDLDPFLAPTALYFDEVTTPLNTDVAVNALADMTVSGTIALDALYTAYPVDLHLTMGSPCIGKGTPAGAPAIDFEGTPRDPATPTSEPMSNRATSGARRVWGRRLDDVVARRVRDGHRASAAA